MAFRKLGRPKPASVPSERNAVITDDIDFEKAPFQSGRTRSADLSMSQASPARRSMDRTASLHDGAAIIAFSVTMPHMSRRIGTLRRISELA
jgi:hypothetical protein